MELAYVLGAISVVMSILAAGCLLSAVLNRLVPKSKSEQGEYVVEPLTEGWFCRNPTCGVFNGDAKEFFLSCRTCGSDRPKHSAVRFRS